MTSSDILRAGGRSEVVWIDTAPMATVRATSTIINVVAEMVESQTIRHRSMM